MSVISNESGRYNFERKLFFVTGAARGIGFAVCKYLVKCRAYIVMTDIRTDELDKAHTTIQEESPDCTIAS
jgi:NAD(P)-dependent dehydrogenase (short-subunit alcohol dehydrogenase family)